VRSEDDAPIANAPVTARGEVRESRYDVKIDAYGHYTVVLAAANYQLEATHQDHAAQWKNVDLRDTEQTTEFVLAAGSVIRAM
jgi:hypothetical protein